MPTTPYRALVRFFNRYVRHVAVALTLVVALAGVVAYAPFPAAASAPVAQPLPSAIPGTDLYAGDPFVRSELYFGTNRPDQPPVSDQEWEDFLDNQITPRFPDGLTVLKGYGQFRNASGVTIEERSVVLILLYPVEARAESSAKIEEIRDLYEESFEQESVLRVDDFLPARVSF